MAWSDQAIDRMTASDDIVAVEFAGSILEIGDGAFQCLVITYRTCLCFPSPAFHVFHAFTHSPKGAALVRGLVLLRYAHHYLICYTSSNFS